MEKNNKEVLVALEERDKDENTPLHLAARGGHLHLVKHLERTLPADGFSLLLRERNLEGDTPLHLAIGHVEVTKRLLLYPGADPNMPDSRGLSSLQRAINKADIATRKGRGVFSEGEVAALLKDHRTDINQFTSRSCESALHMAVRYGWLTLVQALLEDPRIVPNATSAKGKTPLHLGINNCPEVREYLLSCPEVAAGINVPDEMGDTPLHLAVLYLYHGDFEAFFTHPGLKGFPLNAPNKKGDTPLHVAATQGNISAARILLATPGTNPFQENNNGKTPLMEAMARGNTDIASLLSKMPPALEARPASKAAVAPKYPARSQAIRAGMRKAADRGVPVGRPPVPPRIFATQPHIIKVRKALLDPKKSIRQIAKEAGVSPGTVMKVKGLAQPTLF